MVYDIMKLTKEGFQQLPIEEKYRIVKEAFEDEMENTLVPIPLCKRRIEEIQHLYKLLVH